MTKEQVLADISKLIQDIGKCTDDYVEAALNHDHEAYENVVTERGKLLLTAYHKLAFLYDYIKEGGEQTEVAKDSSEDKYWRDLRNQAASRNLQAMLGNNEINTNIGKEVSSAEEGIMLQAKIAVMCADALICALQQEPEWTFDDKKSKDNE